MMSTPRTSVAAAVAACLSAHEPTDRLVDATCSAERTAIDEPGLDQDHADQRHFDALVEIGQIEASPEDHPAEDRGRLFERFYPG